MKKYKFVVITTFRKHFEIEAENEDEAFDEVVNNLDGATDTTDFDTEVEREEE